ncbi:MAG: hypothetical protein FD143_3343 [Ignavibacteria bacterium]|nr:MAG: hypothetical protein FD143_3343 [Ignavibacteria bacterium]
MKKKTARKMKPKINNNKECAEILKEVDTTTSDKKEKDCKFEGTVEKDVVNEKDDNGKI